MEEKWADIQGYESLYEVSTTGKVVSKKRFGTSGGEMVGFVSKGYKRVLLTKDGQGKHYSVHRIVANTFLERIESKPHVNHIDGSKENNNVLNLEWCTRSENQLHAYKIGLQKTNITKAHQVRHEKTKIPILQFNLNGTFLKEFSSIREAAKSSGIKDGTHISAVAKGKRRTCGEYIWKYK